MEFLPQTPGDERAILALLGLTRFEQLLDDVPQAVRLAGPVALPPALSELEVVSHLKALAARNTDADQYACFLGAGAYDHYIPSVVSHLASRGEFATSYTPYQAEMSQGLLQAIFEYQTMICELTGLEVANASLYDGASALAEAVLMAMRVTGRSEVWLSETIHPAARAVCRTYLRGQACTVRELPVREGTTDLEALRAGLSDRAACVAVQHPNIFGCLEEPAAAASLIHVQGGLLIAMVDPISLGLLEPPGASGADIAVGEGQGLGNAMSFGGPYLGFFATRMAFVRQMPGRLVGETTDAEGRRGFCLTLQAREQHIRRERATSNICTNQSLNALMSAIYLATVGPAGLREVARQCLQKAHHAQALICDQDGYRLAFPAPFFKEFTVRVPEAPAAINQRLLRERILGGVAVEQWYPALSRHMLFCVTEKRTGEEINRLVKVLGG